MRISNKEVYIIHEKEIITTPMKLPVKSRNLPIQILPENPKLI